MLSFFRDLLFPITCFGCRLEGGWLCDPCFRRLKFSGPTETGARIKVPALDRLYIAGNYSDPLLAELIRGFKFAYVRDLAPILGRFLSSYWSGQTILSPPLSQATLIPVPLSKKRERWRGFNQARLLAEEVAGELGLKVDYKLERTRDRPPQSTLSGVERVKNLTGAFSWTGQSLAGQTLILVDDVVTTGATLGEAALALKKAGARSIYGLVLAKG